MGENMNDLLEGLGDDLVYEVPKMDLLETGRRIRKLREKYDLSATELAMLMHLSGTSTVSKWEFGHNAPTLDNVIALSGIFHVPIEEIVAIEHPKN